VFEKDFLLFAQWLCCGHYVRKFSTTTSHGEENPA
jgi:hypothetical protein